MMYGGPEQDDNEEEGIYGKHIFTQHAHKADAQNHTRFNV